MNEDYLSRNITKVGFGIRYFSDLFNETTAEKDIRFSDEQEGELGFQHYTAHIVYHALHGLMWICLILPIAMAVYNRWWVKMEPLDTLSKLVTSLARFYVPMMLVLTILMIIPFVLLSKSNLCGRSYVQLGFAAEEASSSSDEKDDCDSIELEGTYAIIHDDIESSCEIGPSGIGFLAATILWPLIILVQIYFLRRRSKSLERQHQLNVLVLDHKDFSIDQGLVEGVKDLADDQTSVSSSDCI